uniref:Ubiquitin-like domain-containing protein n=1 Tax=Nelumbo nucifera TaxID=4432 RepID=A0A822YFY8_NELNU|nr:TPA_asm: hypothetical protein HUJ06_031353 [Nelumbo nucifera]
MVVINVMHNDNIYRIKQRCKSVRDVKYHLQDHVSYHDQLLVYKGELLTNEEALSDMGILEDEDYEVEMYLYRRLRHEIITVIVETEDGVLYIDIPSDDEVLKLKNTIDRRVGITPRRQNLTTLGVRMYEQWKLEDYAIATRQTVQLREKPPNPEWFVAIDVEVPSTGQSMVIKVDRYDTVYTLKGLIRRADFAEKPDFHLQYKGKRLDGTVALISYGIIEDEDTVNLIYD